MRILTPTIGSWGDVQPFIAVAQGALVSQARGHADVAYGHAAAG